MDGFAKFWKHVQSYNDNKAAAFAKAAEATTFAISTINERAAVTTVQ